MARWRKVKWWCMFSSAYVAGSIQPVPPPFWYLVTAEWTEIPKSVAAQEDAANRHLASSAGKAGKIGAVSKNKSASSQHQCTDFGRAAREPLVDCVWNEARRYWNYDNLFYFFKTCNVLSDYIPEIMIYFSLDTEFLNLHFLPEHALQ